LYQSANEKAKDYGIKLLDYSISDIDFEKHPNGNYLIKVELVGDYERE